LDFCGVPGQDIDRFRRGAIANALLLTRTLAWVGVTAAAAAAVWLGWCCFGVALCVGSDIETDMAAKFNAGEVMSVLNTLCQDDPSMADDVWAAECDESIIVVIGHLAMAAQIPFAAAYDRVAFINCACS